MFKQFLEKYNLQEKFIAVGVSGGSDSLALVLMLNDELCSLGYKIIALTVNHNLRPSAADEAEYVAQIMKHHNIEHHTLVWQHQQQLTGIEEAARSARYDLLTSWCKAHGINILMTAHHLNDQVETFFMRLQRGSGLDGLCGMKECSQKDNILILRPLLYTSPDIMKKYLLDKNLKWVEDESNQCTDFLRVKMRLFLPQFYKATGITPQRIGQTMQRLLSSRNLLEKQTEKFINNACKNWFDYGYSCSLNKFYEIDDELKFRVLSALLKKVGKDEYPPRAEKILSLISKINTELKSTTLGHCCISLLDNKFWIFPEYYDTNNFSAKNWHDFIKKNPTYKKAKLPLRLKAYIFNLYK